MKEQSKINIVCSNCKTRETPLWRKGPNDTYNCNACGLYYKIYKRHRPFQYKNSSYRHRKRSRKADGDGFAEFGDSAPGRGGTLLRTTYRGAEMGGTGRARDGQPGTEGRMDRRVVFGGNERGKFGDYFDTSISVSIGKNKNDVEEKHKMLRGAEDRKTRRGRGSVASGCCVSEKEKCESADVLGKKGSQKRGAGDPARILDCRKARAYCRETPNRMQPARQPQLRHYGTYGQFSPETVQFSTYPGRSRGIAFPEVKVVSFPGVPSPLGMGRRAPLLSDEEIEAAEALASFMQKAKHGVQD